MGTSFKSLSESTREDWETIAGVQEVFLSKLADRVLVHLQLLGGEDSGFPVDRLQHCLQTAELAAEAGEDEEYVACALLHDIGDTLGSHNHADVAAAILEPFVSPANHWMVKYHGVFQSYNFFHHLGLDRNLRDQYRDSEHYDRTAHFVAQYDDPAFDAGKPLLSVDLFAPMVKNVFRKPKRSLYKKALDART